MTSPREPDPSLSSLDPLPGRVIAGNFRIDRLIGAGAMGNVYKAEQLSLGKAVAIKVLHPHLMGDDKLVARFKREAKSASLLNHPNSIQIIDSGQDTDGVLYIAMELLTGRDLAQVIREDFPLPLPRVVRVMTQVLSALDEAHAARVVHRDLKPSNIMLIERRGEKDFVKVCDFGIAKATLGEDDRSQMLTIQGLVCGTPEYMSPEQARAEPLDGRADLYSAAVILYQLLTGDIPFRADSPMGIVSRHLSEAPVPPSQRRPDLAIPALVDDIVLRGMEKSAELRFPNAIAFRDALEVMLNATLGPPTPLPPSVRATMPTARDMSGRAGPIPGVARVSTGEVPAVPAAQRFGTTVDMTGGARRGRTVGIAAAIALALAGVGGAALFLRGRPPAPTPAPAASAAPAAPTASPPAPVAAPPAAAPAVTAPAAAPTAAAEPPQEIPAAPAAHTAGGSQLAAVRAEAKRRHAAPHAPGPAAAAPAAPVAAPPAAATPVASAPAPAEPAARGPRELLAEADRLLGQGEVSDACARGEEAKRLGPKLPAVYKFLGKCYMRAGRTREANDDYKQYLDLAPNAPDAPFIKSMIK
jgi:serine/threonine-protein kinase